LNNNGGSSVQIAITEANICHINNVPGDDNIPMMGDNVNTTPGADNLLTGTGANSFLAGQFWAELLGFTLEKNLEVVNFWSVREGDPSSYYKTDVGYIGSEENNKLKPTYWHYQMVANNFRGTLLATSCTAGNYKAFSYKNTALNEIGVLVMNQDQTFPTGPDYGKQFRVNLDGTTPSVTGINVNVAAALPATAFHQCYIKA
jgi:hypothetical protein